MGAAVAIRADTEAAELRRLARRERDGRVSARLIALANVLDGMGRGAAAHAAGMDRQTLRDWVVRFNAEGVGGLRDQLRPGRPTRMTEGQQAAFKAIVLRGPDADRDGVSSWRIVDLCRIAAERFGVVYREGGMLRLVKALDLSWQKTRPRHPKADAAAQERFKRRGLAAALNAIRRGHPAAEVQLWCQDEARVGQKGRGIRVWFERGVRPEGVVDHRHASAWLYAAVRPGTDGAFALVLTEVGAEAMQAFLDRFAASLPEGVHAALLLDGAGWHIAAGIAVPANVSLIFLPPYSPQLNPVERVWLHLRERFLSLRLFADLDDIIDGCCDAWNRLTAEPGRIASLTDYDYLRSVRTS